MKAIHYFIAGTMGVLFAMMVGVTLFLIATPVHAAQEAPICIPEKYGTQFPGTQMFQPRIETGYLTYWFCQRPDGSPKVYWTGCVHGECPSGWGKAGEDYGALLVQAQTKDALSVFGGWWSNQNFAWNCNDVSGEQVAHPGTARGNFCAETNSRIRKTWPVPIVTTPVGPVYTVAINGSTPDRPTYLVTNGVRSKVPGPNRIAVGFVCDSSLKVVEGAVTYMKVAGNYVAICTLKK